MDKKSKLVTHWKNNLRVTTHIFSDRGGLTGSYRFIPTNIRIFLKSQNFECYVICLVEIEIVSPCSTCTHILFVART